MATETQQLRESLIRSLQIEPLLVEAEMSLHSSDEWDLTGEFRQAVAKSLNTAPPLAEVHRESFGALNHDLIDHFRTAMQAAVNSGANLSEAEKQLLGSLDLEKLGEFRMSLDTHFESEPELSKDDLAIYVPAGRGIAETFRRGLELRPVDEFAGDEGRVAAPLLEEPSEPAPPYAPGAQLALSVTPHEKASKQSANPYAPGAFVQQRIEDDLEPLHVDFEYASVSSHFERDAESIELRREGITEELAPESTSNKTMTEAAAGEQEQLRADAAMVAASLRAGLEGGAKSQPEEAAAGASVVHGLSCIPTLTAALEAIGRAGDDFGFLLRYGRYAPSGRKSEFLVGGLGLSELSKNLTGWLESHGSLEDQVQVVDEGSGELTIYLVPAETN